MLQPVECAMLAEFTVVPAKFVVPQGNAVALVHKLFAGGTGAGAQVLEIVNVPVVVPLDDQPAT